MNILLANDDGIDALGIKVLEEGLADLANIYVVAPKGERSTTSHALSLGSGLEIEKRDECHYACSGYPADGVWLALNHLLTDIKFDWVISGINRGANLGQDIYYSGTVAAAREGFFHGIKSIAVSMVLDEQSSEIYYLNAAHAVANFITTQEHSYALYNINVPNLEHPKGIRTTRLGWRYYTKFTDVQQSGDRELFYIGGEYKCSSLGVAEDTTAVHQGYISITQLPIHHDPKL